MVKAVEDDKAVPPAETSYHFKAVPVATKLDTVAMLQKVWEEAAGGDSQLLPTTYEIYFVTDIPPEKANLTP